jgi:hypothetical protein
MGMSFSMGLRRMRWRIRMKSLGLSKSSRSMVRTTLVPGTPLMRLEASMTSIFLLESPSILTMRSPGMTPARAAGVSSMGATTTNCRSRTASSIPTPPKCPEVSSCMDLNSSGVMKTVWGSRDLSMPRMAL